jgi:predicted nucleotidyltransferase
MGAEQILEKLRTAMPKLKQLGVTDIRLFGSHVRGDASPDSDVDLLVSMSNADFATYCRILELLEKELNRKVDLVMVEALKPAYRERVLKEAVRVA